MLGGLAQPGRTAGELKAAMHATEERLKILKKP